MPTEDIAQSWLGRSRARLLIEAVKLEAELFAYYNSGVGKPPIGGPEPHDIDFKALASAQAIVGVLGSVAFPDPDGDEPNPRGPLGPVSRDVLIGLTVFQLASQVSDKASSRAVGKAGADLIGLGAKQLAESSK